ncbi:MAG: hypothetical protein K2Q45_03180 [Nitrosomonas sp.]|nr:hypothetical protein [Nitrosomonas sp.]
MWALRVSVIVLLFASLFGIYHNVFTSFILGGGSADQVDVGRQTMLVIMVKNEELVIERLLTSVKKGGGALFLFVCDTGSTDKTLDIVSRVWRQNYRIYETNFTNFEVTRNECNERARLYFHQMRSLVPTLNFVLLADADFVFVDRPSVVDVVPFNINTIQIHAGISGHPHNSLHMLIRFETFVHCRYRLWTHEYLDCSAAKGASIGYYSKFYYVDYADGKSRADKLKRDIVLLEQWLLKVNEQDLRPRALYYLARAHEDSGNYEDALLKYREHNEVQLFTNYLFYAKYRMALIKMRQMYASVSANQTSLKHADAIVQQAFLNAIDETDGYFRQEPLYWLARYFRQRGQLNKCIMYSSAGLNLPAIDHSRMPLFMETYIQDWAMEEELAFCLKSVGRNQEAIAHYKHILSTSGDRLDENATSRIMKMIY